MFLGLRTVIYPAPDLAASKAWYTALLGFEPYFDEPFYVGFEVGGYELGLHPAADTAVGAVSYWGVSNADDALATLLAAGAAPPTSVTGSRGAPASSIVWTPSASARRTASPSIRANICPTQPCTPAPNPTCPAGLRLRSKRSGSG